tara:strand:+ start:684 stop:794 length:111 start_codon:yes stop_codon:yes gene_type:complete
MFAKPAATKPQVTRNGTGYQSEIVYEVTVEKSAVAG